MRHRLTAVSLSALVFAGAALAQRSAPLPAPGKTFRDCPECPEMVVVPPGSFVMGSPATEKGRDAAEGPQHTVTLAKPFAMSAREVTRREFAAFVREANYKPARNCGYRTGLTGDFKYDRKDFAWDNPGFEQGDDHPVLCVSWNDAVAYAAWLSRKTSRSYRLPTDSEWEYAARAGTTTSRPWGDEPNQACAHANVSDRARDERLAPGTKPGPGTHDCDDKYSYTAPVGKFAPNPFGLYDVIGNVWEWVDDCWNKTMDNAPADGAAWHAGNCALRTTRGGSWIGPPPGGMRLAKRGAAPAARGYINLGIRVAASSP